MLCTRPLPYLGPTDQSLCHTRRLLPEPIMEGSLFPSMDSAAAELVWMPLEMILHICAYLRPADIRCMAHSCPRLRAVLLNDLASPLQRLMYPRSRPSTPLARLLHLEWTLASSLSAAQLPLGPLDPLLDLCGPDTLDAANRAQSWPDSMCGVAYLWKEVQRLSARSLVTQEWAHLLSSPSSLTSRSRVTPRTMLETTTMLAPIDTLEFGVCLLSMALDPSCSVVQISRRLDLLAAEVASLPNTATSFVHAVRASLAVLDRHGIGGAIDESYYLVENSSIWQVICDKGRGIPISLSMVLRSILLRCGYHLELLNVPGHYVTLFRDETGQSHILDAYHKTVLTIEDFELSFAQSGGQWSSTLLTPVTSCIPIWTRMLNNICVAVQRDAGQGNQHIGLLAMQELLLLYQAEGSELAVKLHFQLLKTFVDQRAKAELIWATNQQCVPLMPRFGSRWTNALVMSWISTPAVSRPPDLDYRVRLGTFVVGPPSAGALLGVIVGWSAHLWDDEDPRRVLVLYEGDSLEVRANERVLAYLEVPQEYPLRNIRIGRFFVEFDLGTGRYIPNKWLLNTYSG